MDPQFSDYMGVFLGVLRERYREYVVHFLTFPTVARMDRLTRSLSFASVAPGSNDVAWSGSIHSMQFEFQGNGKAQMFIGGVLTVEQSREIFEKSSGVEVLNWAVGERAQARLAQAVRSNLQATSSSKGASGSEGGVRPAARAKPEAGAQRPSVLEATADELIRELDGAVAEAEPASCPKPPEPSAAPAPA